MKFEFDINTVDDIAKGISVLISKGEEIAEATGEHFWAGNEQYIPASSDEWEDYRWVREDHYLPHDQGFWYSSSMSRC
ncbi:hypothetical protein [Kosakonia phage 305]|uniref:Uncharacterized protein n=1 Tax=Kosakonia phage 305 TaxID=2863193 RepID=A0AAE7WG41_9CAUD|nr:hypothetical protein PP421_gp142 [Kosakonia phage 305]QYN80293.1 hypothetical protein [Kosakonia phage 305]